VYTQKKDRKNFQSFLVREITYLYPLIFMSTSKVEISPLAHRRLFPFCVGSMVIL